ncbi:hypothetical protein ACJIZ3_003986 [Penstemon smallii]|uniref:C2 NT-type domain-containing protein n=1 Tax=Penstemon smallii TaxID=265156 RepID=A0ABD3S0Y1_9LAMI
MFKSARWKSEKNKIKVDFKLQFHAAQLTQLEADSLMISIVPADVGKPTAKSDKVEVRNGSCLWENPVYENVKFNRDPKSGKILERIYYFVVGTGSSKAGVIGEASIDFSSYAEATKISLVSLPLKNSKTEAVLHVSIQRIHDSIEQREVEEIENAKGIFKDHSLKSQLEESDVDQIIRSSSIEDLRLNKTDSHMAELKRNSLVSSGSDVTLLSSEGVEIPWLNSEEASDIVIEKLKTEIFSLSRQAEMSELELQTLRKQIVKESKRGNDFFKEVVSLKEERERLKTNSHFEGGDSKAIIEELRQELNNAKELNFNLQIQLQKMQESNSELILAVRDLEEMLENKNRETREVGPTYQTNDEVEQEALDELVKERSDSKETYLLEQQIMDLRSEIEIFKRDKDELEIQMEQLALDYEIIKQENHDMLYKLEQSQIQEQLKIQYECSPFYNERELESQIENLEIELKKRTKESEDSLIRITKLETHIKDLEKEFEQQEEGFEADLEALTCSKVEQEKRAIKAEESLRKTRWQNANMAERIQEEFRRISLQMTSTFEANERLAVKALEEAKKLQFEKKQLEEMLQKLSDEILILKDEIELYSAKNKILVEQMEDKETLKGMLEKTRLSVKEMELLVEQGNDERIDLENNFMFVKNEAEELHMELNKLRCLLEEKESIVGNLQV